MLGTPYLGSRRTLPLVFDQLVEISSRSENLHLHFLVVDRPRIVLGSLWRVLFRAGGEIVRLAVSRTKGSESIRLGPSQLLADR